MTKRKSWERMYHLSQAYISEKGTFLIPQSYITETGEKLGIWLNKQRMDYKKGVLTKERQKCLEALGIDWTPEVRRRGRWDEKLKMLEKYILEHGNALVPADYVTEHGVRLGTWVSNQRSLYSCGKLTAKRLRSLETAGMVWNVLEEQWEAQYQLARAYYESHGTLHMRRAGGKDMPEKLKNWLTCQRRLYRAERLSKEQIEKLESIGISWEPVREQWMEMYEKAAEYYAAHGHLRVPKERGSNAQRKLGCWISGQRKCYKKNGRLEGDREELLNAIGMVWDASVDIDRIWESWFAKAEAFYQEYGHLEPPEGQLRTWVQTQKYKYKGNRGGLTDEQKARLTSIGIVWDVQEDRWMHMYKLAREYYQIHEKLNIPVSYCTAEGECLGEWIARQRQAYKNWQLKRKGGGLPQISREQIALLNQIEMIWDGSLLSAKTSFQEQALQYYLKQQGLEVHKLSQWEWLGCELDVYLPERRVGIEYDGHMHGNKKARDEKKNHVCREHGIRLLRIREPGLPLLENGAEVILLEDLSEKAFERAIRQVFAMLFLPQISVSIAADRPAIYESYRDYVTYRWDQAYEEAWRYVESTGRLPGYEEGGFLVSWLHSQRQAYEKGELTKRQIAKLEKLGVCWSLHEDRWEKMYALAEAYYQKYHHLEVSSAYVTEQGERLGQWIVAQRGKRRQGKLSENKVILLERLGIRWDPCEEREASAWHSARFYVKKHGQLDAPATYVDTDGIRLGEWIFRWRKAYREGTLPSEKVRVLENWGISWQPKEDAWEAMYREAAAYYEKWGSLWISPDYVTDTGVQLGAWLSRQRKRYTNPGRNAGAPLTQEQIQKLEAIGMIWDPYRVKWMEKYKLAKAYYETYGHLQIPNGYVTLEGVKLGMWLGTQRQAYRGNPNYHMTEERQRLLKEIGMDWLEKGKRRG